MFGTFVSFFTGLVILFPFIIFIIIGLMNVKRKRKVSLQQAADVTNFFLIASVSTIATVTFGKFAMIVIALIVFCIVIGFAIYERRRKKDFNTQKVMRNAWRLLFLIFSLSYFILIICGIILSIVQHLA